MVIDWSRIETLRGDIGSEDFAEVAALFLEEMGAGMVDLDSAAGQKALEAQLHFLKGAALNLGFAAFADLCQTGESAAAQGRTGAVDIAALRAAYQSARSEFLAGTGCAT